MSASTARRAGEGDGGAERIALLINPRATCVGVAERARVAHELAPLGVEWTFVTRRREDTPEMARRAVAAGASVIVTLGGDGTVADVAGVIADSPVAMLPLPGGNANVFTRAVGWPGDIDGALDLVGAAIREGGRREVRAGLVDADGARRPFIVNCGIGIDAETVEWIETRPRTNHRLRQVGYAIGAVTATLRARRAIAAVEVRPEHGDPLVAASVLVATGSPYTYMGRRPLDLVPGADFAGHLRWAALERVRAVSLSRLMLGAARGRATDAGARDVTLGDVGARLEMHCRRAAAVQVDGEMLGRHERVVVTPGPLLSVVVPALG